MTTEELGKALTQTRTARGLTLHDVERDTRINRKYLQALEEGQLEEMPAPVYARAFLRTYAQYLGLNARALVQQLPGAKPEPELPPLPQLEQESRTPLLSASWLVAGAVVILLIGVGLFLFWSRGGSDAPTTAEAPVAEVVDPDADAGQGAEQPEPPADQPLPAPNVEPGIVPDLEGQDALIAIDALAQAGIPYIVVEAENPDAAAGTVFSQSPAPGAAVEDGTVVTITVAR